jgi:hypothetical protein
MFFIFTGHRGVDSPSPLAGRGWGGVPNAEELLVNRHNLTKKSSSLSPQSSALSPLHSAQCLALSTAFCHIVKFACAWVTPAPG